MLGNESCVTCGDLSASRNNRAARSQLNRSTCDIISYNMQGRIHSRQKFSPEYVVGLADGEGSFTVYVRNPDLPINRTRRVLVEPKFYIKLVEKDKIILDELVKFFGCGRVYFQKDARPNHQNCYRYEVYRRDDLVQKIIPFFRENPLRFPSKKHDFQVFCEMMTLINQGHHKNKTGLNELFELKQHMH